jgi:hypothetical protein
MTETIAIIAERVYRWFEVQSQVTEGRVPGPSLDDLVKCSKSFIMSLDALSEDKSQLSTQASSKGTRGKQGGMVFYTPFPGLCLLKIRIPLRVEPHQGSVAITFTSE